VNKNVDNSNVPVSELCTRHVRSLQSETSGQASGCGVLINFIHQAVDKYNETKENKQ